MKKQLSFILIALSICFSAYAFEWIWKPEENGKLFTPDIVAFVNTFFTTEFYCTAVIKIVSKNSHEDQSNNKLNQLGKFAQKWLNDNKENDEKIENFIQILSNIPVSDFFKDEDDDDIDDDMREIQKALKNRLKDRERIFNIVNYDAQSDMPRLENELTANIDAINRALPIYLPVIDKYLQKYSQANSKKKSNAEL